jgi:hypothetical protein
MFVSLHGRKREKAGKLILYNFLRRPAELATCLILDGRILEEPSVTSVYAVMQAN